MTASTNLDSRTPEQLREDLHAAMERLRKNFEDGLVDESHVIECMRDWRPDMSAVGLWVLWQHIDTALTRLEEISSPMWCPSQGDAEVLEQEWTASLRFGLERLMGARP